MIKVGLVGYGFMGHMHVQCYTATGEAKVVAIADVDPAKLEEAKEKLGVDVYSSIEEMLASADIDIVDICTPTYLHEKHVTTTAIAGKDMMCEKPLSLNVESCDRMINAVKSANVKVMVGQVIRFWPEYMVIKEIVDSGKYGKALWASAQRRSSFPTTAWENWYSDPQKSGGALLDLHIHDADFLRYLLGTPKKVIASGTKSPEGAINAVQCVGMEHESGAHSSSEGALDLANGFPFNMALLVACEKATLKFDISMSPSLMVYPTDEEAFAPEMAKPNIGSSTETSGNISDLGGYYNEIKYYIDCLKANKAPEKVTIEDAREAVRICVAEAKSVDTGEIVEL